MFNIRKASVQDAPAWIELLRSVWGDEYPDPQVYDAAWVAQQLGESEAETWVAEEKGFLHCALSFLGAPGADPGNPVANIGRHLNRPDSYAAGAATALLNAALQLASQRKQLLVSRVLASDPEQQALYEAAGFTCAGFQPFKHSCRKRENAIFYYRVGGHDISTRLPLSESLPQVAELAQLVLHSLNFPPPALVRDGVTGYPLQAEAEFGEGTREDYELWKIQAAAQRSPVEISGVYNQGLGYLKVMPGDQSAAAFTMKDGRVAAGILYVHDPVDRCVRLIDSFSLDDLALGPLLGQMVRKAQQQLSALYIEMDVLATAPRLLKSAEQCGFVPVAWLPAIYWKEGRYTDIVKMVKLNLVYALENAALSAHVRRVADVVDQSFQDQKMGVAIIHLLRELPFFEGLGDGELRKISRLFNQKLYRANEVIFPKGASGNEAYVVMRGQIEIHLEPGTGPIAQFGNGQIFGELAFLDGSPRAAQAIATQPTILLVIQRSAFNTLVQREPHLGMIVMRNIALELTKRLRKTNLAMNASREPAATPSGLVSG